MSRNVSVVLTNSEADAVRLAAKAADVSVTSIIRDALRRCGVIASPSQPPRIEAGTRESLDTTPARSETAIADGGGEDLPKLPYVCAKCGRRLDANKQPRVRTGGADWCPECHAKRFRRFAGNTVVV